MNISEAMGKLAEKFLREKGWDIYIEAHVDTVFFRVASASDKRYWEMVVHRVDLSNDPDFVDYLINDLCDRIKEQGFVI